MRFLKSSSRNNRPDLQVLSEFRTSGDLMLIGILFDRYSHLVFAVAMNYLKDEDESKDAVMKIFEKLPSDIKKYEISNFSSWLHSVTRNHCLRQISNNKFTTADSDFLQLVPDVQTENSFPEAELVELEEAITQLNEEQKKCIDLFYLKEKSYRQIADETGFTLNQVKSFIQNGKRNLKIILTKGSHE
jgi:RNA polymerase sigma factor (sigma-70 family)